MRTLATVIAFVSLLGRSALAQELPKPGRMVRVEIDSNQVLAGPVINRSGDSLWIGDTNRGVLTVVRPQIRNLSVYGPQWRKGAKRGAMVGGLVGVVGLGTAIWADTHAKVECICVPLSFVAAPVAAALPIIGASVGLLFAPKGWSKQRGY